MRVTVNGKEREFTDGLTIAELLVGFGLDAGRTVVELNRKVVDRDGYAAAALREGDVLELVEVVGGG